MAPNDTWTAHFYVMSLSKEGATEKVSQFKIALESIYNKNVGFVLEKIISWNLRIYNLYIFLLKTLFILPFQSL